MNNQQSPNLAAGGTIRPYRFVKVSTAADNTGLEADANEVCCGVAAGSTRQFDSANHAESGDSITLQPGNIVMIEAAGAITRGSRIKSDANGAGVVALGTGTTTQYTAGIALETAASGTITRMLWQPSADRPALS